MEEQSSYFLPHVIVLTLVLLLSSCNSPTYSPHKPKGILIVATMGDVVFVGFSNTRRNFGKFELRSVYGRQTSCIGQFNFLNYPAGTGKFECTNNQSGSVKVTSNGEYEGKGQGAGTSTLGPVKVIYGYPVAEVNLQLKLPEGKMLIQNESGIGLIDR